MNYLLDAVDKLTQNHVSKVMQTKTIEYRPRPTALNPDPEPSEWEVACVSVVDHEPLLLMLRDSVAGGIGSHSGSSSARERIPFDAGALELFDEIAAQVNTWYVTLPNAREDRYIHDRLREWYIDFENRRRMGKIIEAEELAMERLVEGWARRIEAMFDPPTVFEVTTVAVDEHGLERNKPVECPLCENDWAIDPKTRDRISAVVIEYRNEGTTTLDNAVGLCRFCGAVWRGRLGVRELRYAIEQREVANAATDTLATT